MAVSGRMQTGITRALLGLTPWNGSGRTPGLECMSVVAGDHRGMRAARSVHSKADWCRPMFDSLASGQDLRAVRVYSVLLCHCPAEALDSRLLRWQFAPTTMGSRMPPGPSACPLSCCMPVIHEHQAHPSEVHGWYSTMVTSLSENPSAMIAEMITSHHPRSRHRYWQANPLPEMTFLHPSIAMHERIAS